MARRTKQADVKVEATVHRKAQRKNIPTAELEAFTVEDERQPKRMLYPRDPSLDPQLVWKGKEEQDRHPLEVPSVPIYIQEKISPQALIEELRAENVRNAQEQQIDLFSDFNGLPFEQMVDFYQHDQKWTNRMILGDSLLVMASLADKEGLKGKVQMIYIDPPYGIKSARTGRCQHANGTFMTVEPKMQHASRNRSAPFEIRGSLASTLTYRICAIDSRSQPRSSLIPDRYFCRSATRTCTSFGPYLTRSLAPRTS